MALDSRTRTTEELAGEPLRPAGNRGWLDLIRPLASLRLTVGLFLASIVLIMVGTLAQVDKNMWEVLELYFRTWFTWVDFQVLLPRSFFPRAPQVPGGFPFLGGKAIGLLLFVNLIAAHSLRFRVAAKGHRLAVGLAVSALGIALIAVVVVLGHNSNGLQGQPLIAWGAVWQMLRWSFAAIWIGSLVLLLRTERAGLVWWSYLTACVALGLLSFYLVVTGGEPQLSDSSLRIVWQLLQGGLAGGVLLVGAMLLFKQRGGIVVIHAAVALLMLSELLVGMTAVEEQMVIREGETVDFAREAAKIELAAIDVTHPEYDDVTVVPDSILKRAQLVQDNELPFDIEPVAFYKNARLREVENGDQNPATAGIGLRFLAEPVRGSSGASGDEMDIAAAYVRLIPKDDPTQAAVYLLSQQFGDARLFSGVDENLSEKLTFPGRRLELSLRQKRNYKPYTVRLDDLRKDDYLGTDLPRDYSSYITLNDPESGVRDQKIRIWMNNPLRYAGQTLYQTNYANLPSVGEVTTLSVVTNTGWMIPYVACMLALIGMSAHFLGTLSRFVNRLQSDLSQRLATAGPRSALETWAAPVTALALCGLLLYPALQPAPQYAGMDLEAFGRLPIVYQGRSKPIDTYARNALKIVSNKQSYSDPSVPKKSGKPSKQPATKWLLDVATQTDRAGDHPVFYIPDFNVQTTLGLDRKKHFRYSLNEFRDRLEQFDQELGKARQNDVDLLTHAQRKLIEVGRRLHNFRRLVTAFRPLPFPELPSPELRERDPEKAEEMVRDLANMAMQVPRVNAALLSDEPPLVVPVQSSDGEQRWLPYSVAMNEAFVQTALQRAKPDRNLIEWNRILDAYSVGDSEEFNRAVGSYTRLIEKSPPEGVDLKKIQFESLFNRLQPFSLCASLYVLAFVVNAVGWLGWFQPMRRTAFWLILFTFTLHSAALLARIYISGRPPVTNLYSSAVFIGWGLVMFCIVLESIFPISIGNLLATIGGFATLIIAHNLAGDGDTFTVLRAVLDTQFWLATHVVSVTWGYLMTFAAGGLATIYILGSLLVPKFSPEIRRSITRMTYGALCFAILFSFVGTVLGGLWADDSWGRFWGWDPKENGALIIVLWNALVLHARWGGMVKERGLAALAVLGNVATAWSWFGVNELGIGLHSYGFTEGALLNLGLFVVSQLLLAGVCAFLPLRFWRSRQGAAVA